MTTQAQPTDVMIDCEYLSGGTRPVLLSIGCIAFAMTDTLEQIHERVTWWYRTCSIDQQLQMLKRTVDASTLKWWMQQSLRAQEDAVDRQANSLNEQLINLNRWYKSISSIQRVWSHGAANDLAILKQAYYELDIPLPWGRRQMRDTNTLFEWYPEWPMLRAILQGYVGKDVGPLHHALADAKRQAYAMTIAWQYLQKHCSLGDPAFQLHAREIA